jgi:cell division protein FtsQ
LLEIDTIVVNGNEHLSSGEVLALVGGLPGTNILTADLEANRNRLLTSGWVKAATLRRVLPSTVEVDIEERQPVGLGRFGATLYLVDATGTVVDEYGPRFTTFRLPIIDGLMPPGEQGVVVDEARAPLAARLLTDLRTRPALSERVSQIDVRDPYNAIVLLSEDSTRLHLGHELFVARLDEYFELAPALRARVPEIDYVDLRFDQRVYVRPVAPAGKAGHHAMQMATSDVTGTRTP